MLSDVISNVLKASLPRVETLPLDYRTHRVNIARIRRDGWLIVLLGLGLGVGLSALLTDEVRRYISPGNISSLLLLSAFLLLLIGDFTYAFTALAAGRRLSLQCERLDQLRLTALSSDAIVASEFAAWQLHMWRLMAFECSLRIALVTLLSLGLVQYGSFLLEDSRALESVVVSSPILLLFVIGPLWRMHALGSVALHLGFRSGNVIFAGLLACVTALASHAPLAGVFYIGLYLSILLMLNSCALAGFSLAACVWLTARFSFRSISLHALDNTARALRRAMYG